jgi:hypothetical protein
MKEVAKKVKILEPINAGMIAIRMDHYFPNAYLIDLPLDSTPDHVWQEIFNRTWKSSRHIWDRKLYVMGDKLRLVTADSNVEEKLDWVKSVLELTNKEIEEYNKEAQTREAQMEEELKKQTANEEAKIEKIKDTLQRRFPTI